MSEARTPYPPMAGYREWLEVFRHCGDCCNRHLDLWKIMPSVLRSKKTALKDGRQKSDWWNPPIILASNIPSWDERALLTRRLWLSASIIDSNLTHSGTAPLGEQAQDRGRFQYNSTFFWLPTTKQNIFWSGPFAIRMIVYQQFLIILSGNGKPCGI